MPHMESSADTDAVSDSSCICASLTDPQQFGLIFQRHAGSVHRYLLRRIDATSVDAINLIARWFGAYGGADQAGERTPIDDPGGSAHGDPVNHALSFSMNVHTCRSAPTATSSRKKESRDIRIGNAERRLPMSARALPLDVRTHPNGSQQTRILAGRQPSSRSFAPISSPSSSFESEASTAGSAAPPRLI